MYAYKLIETRIQTTMTSTDKDMFKIYHFAQVCCYMHTDAQMYHILPVTN